MATSYNALFMVGLLVVAGMAVIGWALPGKGTSYSINYATLNTAGLVSVTLPSTIGFVNCTGVTSNPITIKSSTSLLVSGQYGVADVNSTGWYMWVNLEIGTNPPATSFGNGDCASGATAVRTSMYFPVTGVANVFTVSFSYVFTVTVGSTYYAWYSLNQRGVNTGHVNMRSQGSSFCSFLLQEER